MDPDAAWQLLVTPADPALLERRIEAGEALIDWLADGGFTPSNGRTRRETWAVLRETLHVLRHLLAQRDKGTL